MSVADASVDYAALFREEDVLTEAPDMAPPSSWVPVDVASVLALGLMRPTPTMLRRDDGRCLLYAGKTHAFNAVPEAAKSLLAQYVCAERIAAQEHVLYLDFESDVRDVLERMRCLGVSDENLAERFHYVRPDDPFDAVAKAELLETMARHHPTLAVLDGVAEVLVQNGLSEDSNADVATFLNALPRLLERLGTAVVLIDHLVKDKEAQGRYARGSGHKLAGITGAAYKLEMIRQVGRGLTGQVRITVTKDRPGAVRPSADAGKVADMHVVSDPLTQALTVTLSAPGATVDFRPTCLMERISRALESAGEPMSMNQILKETTGKREARIVALRHLVQDGYVEQESKGQAQLHRSVSPYREADTTRPAEDELR